MASCLIQCHFDYTTSSWYLSLNKALKQKLHTSQNKLIRVVLRLNHRSHMGMAQFQQLQWLPVEARARQIQFTIVHSILNNRAPTYCNNYFKRIAHGHNTGASRGNVALYKHRTKTGGESFIYASAVEWNKLPLSIQEMKRAVSFKSKIRKLLFCDLPL